jgi:hypothetical protein
VALARAGVAQQHDGLAGVHVGAAGQGGDGGRVDRWGGGEVEVGQALHAGETSFVHAPGPAALGPLVHFGREDLGQKTQIGRLGTLGHLGHMGGVGAHHGQAQFPGGRPYGCQGGGVSHGRCHLDPSRSWS